MQHMNCYCQINSTIQNVGINPTFNLFMSFFNIQNRLDSVLKDAIKVKSNTLGLTAKNSLKYTNYSIN